MSSYADRLSVSRNRFNRNPRSKSARDLRPSTVEFEKSEDEIIEKALLQPIGSSPLREILEWCQDVLVLVDDYTAIRLAQKLGFEFCGYNDRYYSNQDITLLFALAI